MEELLSPPEEKKLPAPEEKLLRPPIFWEKYAKFRWLIITIFFILILIMVFSFINKPPASPQTITPTQPHQTPTIDPTSSWKTYKNTKYGYSIQYPSNKFINCGDFYLYEGAEGTRECALGEEMPAFIIINSLEGTGIFQRSVDETCYEIKKESIMIAGTPSTKYSNIIKSTEGKCNSMEAVYARNNIHIIANHNNTIYNFVFYEDGNKELKYKILSTFKFLDQTSDTSNWKTYENSDYSIKYPPDLKLERQDMPDIGNLVGFESKDQQISITITTWEDNEGKTLQQFITDYSNNLATKENTNSYRVGEIQGLGYINGENKLIFINNKNKVFIFILNNTYDIKTHNLLNKNAESTFNQILSTFKFTQ